MTWVLLPRIPNRFKQDFFLQHKLYEQKDLETDKELNLYKLKICFLLRNKLKLAIYLHFCEYFKIVLVPTSLDLNLSSWLIAITLFLQFFSLYWYYFRAKITSGLAVTYVQYLGF